jgi:hypothetical protein
MRHGSEWPSFHRLPRCSLHTPISSYQHGISSADLIWARPALSIYSGIPASSPARLSAHKMRCLSKENGPVLLYLGSDVLTYFSFLLWVVQVLFTPDLWVPLVNLHGVYILPGIPRLFHTMIEAHKEPFRGPTCSTVTLYTNTVEGDLAGVFWDLQFWSKCMQINPLLSLCAYKFVPPVSAPAIPGIRLRSLYFHPYGWEDSIGTVWKVHLISVHLLIY